MVALKVPSLGVSRGPAEKVTADNITDEQIREYVRGHWRELWDPNGYGGAGGGIVNDAAAIFFSSTTSHEWRTRLRGQFAALINAEVK